MATRWQLTVVTLCMILAAPFALHADIYRWDNGEVIPGTEGITPGPGVQLDYRELEHAELSRQDLTGSNFSFSNLTGADLQYSTLTNADLRGAVVTGASLGGTSSIGFTPSQFYSTQSYQAKDLSGVGLRGNDLTDWDFSGQNLTSASLDYSTLTNADLTGAVVTEGDFSNTTSRGFTAEQLYSTASYEAKNLRGIRLSGNDLTNWDFSGQDLSEAAFYYRGVCCAIDRTANLTGANLSRANLTNALLDSSTLTRADLTDAVVSGAAFGRTDNMGTGITKEQLYSTASYQAKSLNGIGLWNQDLTGWDLSGQHLVSATLTSSRMSHLNLRGADLSRANLAWAELTNAVLVSTNLSNADLTSSRLTDADLSEALISGAMFDSITKEQLYSTASYRQKSLRGLWLKSNDPGSWNLRGQDLTDAFLGVLSADVTGAVVTGATLRPMSKDQLYSTASYEAKNLRGMDFTQMMLMDWDLSGQDLTNANLHLAIVAGAKLTGAILKNAALSNTEGLSSAIADSSTIYNQWTVFPSDFDPVARGLKLEVSPRGDLDADDVFDADDVDMLASKIRLGWIRKIWWLSDAAFDMNGDSVVNQDDHRVWVKDLKRTWFGDANLNGEFNSADFVQVFQSGKYEQGWVDERGNIYGETAGWSEGDWNGDGHLRQRRLHHRLPGWRLRARTADGCGDGAGAGGRSAVGDRVRSLVIRFPSSSCRLLRTRFAGRIGERGLSNARQRRDDLIHGAPGVELLGRELANRLAVHRLGLLNRLQIARQCPLVCVRFHALLTRWQTVHQHAGFTRLHERRTGPYADRRTPSEQNLLQSQRPVIVIRQIRTCPGATSGFEELLAVVLAVVDLDVSWEQLGQMLQQHGPVPVLGVDQEIVLIRQRSAGPGIDRVGPHDDGRLVGGTSVLGDQVAIPLGVAEHGPAVGGIEQGTFLGINSRCGGIQEQHVGPLHERQALRIPPGGVATVGPVPEPGDRIAADGERLDREPVEAFVDPFTEGFLQGIHAVGGSAASGCVDRADQFDRHVVTGGMHVRGEGVAAFDREPIVGTTPADLHLAPIQLRIAQRMISGVIQIADVVAAVIVTGMIKRKSRSVVATKSRVGSAVDLLARDDTDEERVARKW